MQNYIIIQKIVALYKQYIYKLGILTILFSKYERKKQFIQKHLPEGRCFSENIKLRIRKSGSEW